MAERIARPRIADVAREAGVSKSAVSFAFNQPGRLRPETGERIREVAARLGYRPHPVARMLSAGQTATLGIVTPQPLDRAFANPFLALFTQGVARVAEAAGFALQFISPLEGSLDRALGRATVDGILVIGVGDRHPEIDALRRTSLPVVVVDAPPWLDRSAMAVDDEGGAREAARHLVALGHRRVLIVSMEPPSLGSEVRESVMARRLRGYRGELLAAGSAAEEPSQPWTVVAAASYEGGEAAFLTAWQDGMRPTGVLAMSDVAAIGVIRAARSLGLAVPRDLSVIGFDDLPFTAFTDPPLTTVHQPVEAKGEEAARMLLQGIADAGSTSRRQVLPTRLVVRGSTSPAPAVGTMRQEVMAHA